MTAVLPAAIRLLSLKIRGRAVLSSRFTNPNNKGRTYGLPHREFLFSDTEKLPIRMDMLPFEDTEKENCSSEGSISTDWQLRMPPKFWLFMPSPDRISSGIWNDGDDPRSLSLSCSACSIVATPHCGDRLFRMRLPLMKFLPLAVISGSPSPMRHIVFDQGCGHSVST